MPVGSGCGSAVSVSSERLYLMRLNDALAFMDELRSAFDGCIRFFSKICFLLMDCLLKKRNKKCEIRLKVFFI